MPPVKRILCVDDDEDTCDTLINLLKFDKYEAKSVGGIEEALDIVQQETFDLYILDTWLLTGSGNSLCGKLRKQFPDIPIIVYSGASFQADVEEAYRAGANAFVPKPYINRLLEAVHRLIG